MLKMQIMLENHRIVFGKGNIVITEIENDDKGTWNIYVQALSDKVIDDNRPINCVIEVDDIVAGSVYDGTEDENDTLMIFGRVVSWSYAN